MAVSGHVVRWDQELGSRPFWAGSYKCGGGFTQPFLGPTFLQGIYRVPTMLMGPSGTEMAGGKKTEVCVCECVCARARAHVICVLPFMWGSEDTGPSLPSSLLQSKHWLPTSHLSQESM